MFVFKNGEAPHINNFELGQHGRRRSNVWIYPGANTFRTGRFDDLSIHPTVKPVAMVADAMRDCSRRGDIVLDPFMGSGTTIMAAERVGRRGYGLEIRSALCRCRGPALAGLHKADAILRGTGQTFEEVAAWPFRQTGAEGQMTTTRKSAAPYRGSGSSRDLVMARSAMPVHPETHRFKPGQSGNPKGRPKGAKNESTILREIFERKIQSRTGNRSRKITMLEGILLRITEDSLKGNTKSAAFLLNRYAAMVSGELQRQDLNDDDRAVLEAFAQRMERTSHQRRRQIMNRSDQRFSQCGTTDGSAVLPHRSVLTLNPGAPFLPNWHLEAIAYRLNKFDMARSPD